MQKFWEKCQYFIDPKLNIKNEKAITNKIIRLLKDKLKLKIIKLMIAAIPNESIWPILYRPSNDKPNKMQNGMIIKSLDRKEKNTSFIL